MLLNHIAVVSILAVVCSVVCTPVPNEERAALTQMAEGTWYNPGLGACGIASIDSDLVVAVSFEMYTTYPGATSNPNLNPICGRSIRANYNDKSVVVAVRDKCSACALNDLDFSPTAFQQLAGLDVGRIGITWDWV